MVVELRAAVAAESKGLLAELMVLATAGLLAMVVESKVPLD